MKEIQDCVQAVGSQKVRAHPKSSLRFDFRYPQGVVVLRTRTNMWEEELVWEQDSRLF